MKFDYYTGNPIEDSLIKQQMYRLLTTGIIPSCIPSTSFDETLMFRDNIIQQKKQELRRLIESSGNTSFDGISKRKKMYAVRRNYSMSFIPTTKLNVDPKGNDN